MPFKHCVFILHFINTFLFKPKVVVHLHQRGLSELNDLINELLFGWYEWLQTKESSGKVCSTRFPCCAFKMLSGFEPAEVNNTFANTFKGSPRFSQVFLLVRDPWGEDKREWRNSTNYTAFWSDAICAASATKTPFVPPAATLCVLIVKHQHLAVVVNLSQRLMPPALPWEPRGHCPSPWCRFWWKRDGTKSLAGFTCCVFVVPRRGNRGRGRPQKVGYR